MTTITITTIRTASATEIFELADRLVETAPGLDANEAFIAAGYALTGTGYAEPLFAARKRHDITTRELVAIGKILAPVRAAAE